MLNILGHFRILGPCVLREEPPLSRVNSYVSCLSYRRSSRYSPTHICPHIQKLLLSTTHLPRKKHWTIWMLFLLPILTVSAPDPEQGTMCFSYFFVLCVCGCEVCVHVKVLRLMCTDQRSTSVHFSIILYLIFWDKVFHWTWSSATG